jgi:hypothetical protein
LGNQGLGGRPENLMEVNHEKINNSFRIHFRFHGFIIDIYAGVESFGHPCGDDVFPRNIHMREYCRKNPEESEVT